MSSFFDKRSWGMRFLSGLGALIIGNFLFLICSIPLFTIGASWTALYRITFEVHMGNDPFVVRDFFRYFKENFKKATLVFVPIVILLAVWIYNLYIVLYILDPSLKWLQYPIYILIVALTAVTIYIFPMIALYEQKVTKMIKDSLLLSIGNLPVTIFIVASYVGKYLLIDFIPIMGVYILSFYMFFGFAFDCWFFGIFINRAFKIEKPKKKRTSED